MGTGTISAVDRILYMKELSTCPIRIFYRGGQKIEFGRPDRRI